MAQNIELLLLLFIFSTPALKAQYADTTQSAELRKRIDVAGLHLQKAVKLKGIGIGLVVASVTFAMLTSIAYQANVKQAESNYKRDMNNYNRQVANANGRYVVPPPQYKTPTFPVGLMYFSGALGIGGVFTYAFSIKPEKQAAIALSGGVDAYEKPRKAKAKK